MLHIYLNNTVLAMWSCNCFILCSYGKSGCFSWIKCITFSLSLEKTILKTSVEILLFTKPQEQKLLTIGKGNKGTQRVRNLWTLAMAKPFDKRQLRDTSDKIKRINLGRPFEFIFLLPFDFIALPPRYQKTFAKH